MTMMNENLLISKIFKKRISQCFQFNAEGKMYDHRRRTANRNSIYSTRPGICNVCKEPRNVVTFKAKMVFDKSLKQKLEVYISRVNISFTSKNTIW